MSDQWSEIPEPERAGLPPGSLLYHGFRTEIGELTEIDADGVHESEPMIVLTFQGLLMMASGPMPVGIPVVFSAEDLAELRASLDDTAAKLEAKAAGS